MMHPDLVLPAPVPVPLDGAMPDVHRPQTGATPPLCDYGFALRYMDELVARPPDARDVLVAGQHPPTITLGRKGGRDHIAVSNAPVFEIARGGSVTWHAPGQLVVYPIVQLARQAGPWGRGPLGDLPAFVRLLEQCVAATCLAFAVQTYQKPGQSGVWLDERRKIASIGLGLRHGWTFHGLALNVDPDLTQFAVTPCGLSGVVMTSLAEACTAQGTSTPTLAAVEADLTLRLQQVLRR